MLLAFFVFTAYNASAQTAIYSATGTYDVLFQGKSTYYSTINLPNDNGVCYTQSGTKNVTLPGGSTIQKAYLFWSGTGSVDNTMVLNGNTITSGTGSSSTISISGSPLTNYGAYADITTLAQSLLTPGNAVALTGSGISYNSSWCSGGSGHAGWAIVVVYSNPSLPVSNIRVYNHAVTSPWASTNSYTLSGIPVPATCRDIKFWHLVWDGDTYKENERLTIGGTTYTGTMNSSTDGDLDIDPYSVTNAASSGSLTFTYSNPQINIPTWSGYITASEVIFWQAYVVKSQQAISVACASTNGTCANGNVGTATVTATGGSGYTYAWSNGATTQSISSLAAGTYSVTVTANGGCTASCSVTVTTQQSSLSAAFSGQDVTCFGGNDGSASASASGGNPPYTYLWSNSATTTSVTGLIAGAYSVTVTDASGCTSTASGNISEPALLVASSSAGIILCNGGTTTVTVSATGGTVPYLGTGSFTVSAGNYSYTVTDANGCSVTATGSVSEPGLLVASSSAGTILCNGGTTTVTVSATGGTALYSGTGSFTVSVGNYSYTITDANGCSATTSINVTEPGLLVASSSAGSILCNGGTTTVIVSATGGTAPYSGTGSFTESAGTYSYSITDANGCSATTTISVSEPSLLIASSLAGSILCNGGTTTVIVSATGGTAPYSGTGSFQVSAGTYSYTVMDDNGCSATTTVTITQPQTVVTLNCNSTNVSTYGGSDGVAAVIVSGGTAPYTYLWNTGATSASLNNVSAGTYSVTVTDLQGCSAFIQCVITEPSINCTGFRTQTQGGWGAICNGNNSSCYLNANFSGAFPNGITIGCSSGNQLLLTNSWAVTSFLPSGSIPTALPSGTLVDPGQAYQNVLAGQLVALTINIGLDVYDPNFAPPTTLLGSLIIGSGPFAGWTVNAFLAEANNVIGGCSSNYSFADVNVTATAINENFDNGTTDDGFLVCPPPPVPAPLHFELSLYPNPTDGLITVNYFVEDMLSKTYLQFTDLTGKLIYSVELDNAVNSIQLDIREDLQRSGSGLYFVKTVNGNHVHNKKLSFINF